MAGCLAQYHKRQFYAALRGDAQRILRYYLYQCIQSSVECRKLYLIPENEYTQWTNHGFVYRKDLAKEAGLSEVASWKDLDTYFRSVTANHPDMIPWDTDGKSHIPALGYLMSAERYVPIYELTTYGIWGEDQDNKNEQGSYLLTDESGDQTFHRPVIMRLSFTEERPQ